MATRNRSPRGKLRGQKPIAYSLDQVVQDTFRLWRKHHLDYDQTKYVVERVRRRLALEPPRMRSRTVARLEQSEVERLIQATYRNHSKYGLMIKTLFQTGARVDEFVHIRVEDLLLEGDPPQIHLTHAKRGADRYVPILPALADELRTHLQGRQTGFLFESNRHTRYSTRTVQSIVTACARTAGITKRVYPHLLRHSIATILLDSGLVPIDQVQKFLGHLHLSTTQIYAETSLGALGDNYLRALGGKR
ncbi:MAG: tyrosine-type recombinase/integrase [Gammaproteobacteria bacterium]